tara:strand:+ start:94 stop:756 length:663 start_codon:yes stop_codon:yes gene_type:complete
MINSKRINFKSKRNKDTYQKWKKIVLKNINSIKAKLVGEIYRHNCDYGISTIDVSFKLNNIKFKRAVQLEGDSVVIIPIIKIKNSKIKKTIMVEQFRISAGKKTLEFPSGGVHKSRYKDQAILELREETSLKIQKEDLIELNKRLINLMPGNNFARVKFYAFYKSLSSKEISKYQNLTLGRNDQGEYTKTKIVNFKDLKKNLTASVLIGIKLIKDLNLIK